jgi:hypothetical protein
MHLQGSWLVMGNIKMCLGTPQTHARQATGQPGKTKPDCPFLLRAITNMCTYNVGGLKSKQMNEFASNNCPNYHYVGSGQINA